MSMTFRANIDYSNIELIKVYAKELYPEFSNSEFECNGFLMEKDTDLYYEMKYPEFDFTHEITLSNHSMRSMFGCIEQNYSDYLSENNGVISFNHEDLPNLKRKIIKAINSTKTNGHTQESFQRLNVFYGGIDKNHLISSLTIILEIVDNAQQRNLSVFCA